MVTDLCDHQMIKDMHMTPVNTLEEALKLAFEMKGADAKVAVIPDGRALSSHSTSCAALNESFINRQER